MDIEIPNFENSNVLIVGDVMLDRYWSGSTKRISPEAPVPVVRISESEERPGGAANVALNVSALKGKPVLLGYTGKDDASLALESRLKLENVDCHFQKLFNIPTMTKLRVMSQHQQLIRLDFEDSLADVDCTEIGRQFRSKLPMCDAVILSDYGKGTLKDVKNLISLARKAKKPVLVDPKGNDFSIYSGSSLITPNLFEFETVVGPCKNEDHLVTKGQQLRKHLHLDALLITRGEKGMTLIQETEVLHFPTKARDVFDVTGAGDTVISVLATSLAAGKSFSQSTALANLAAGIVVGKSGTATATVDELRHARAELEEIENGILEQPRLAEIVKKSQAMGEKVVMTNGCFDILHAGHVTYLEQAKKLGDRLVVAVNDDNSVKNLKGPERPVNGLKHRMTVLSALESVDWVVPFSEETPEKLICNLKPNILVKGGDYRPEDIAGSRCVADSGGEVIVLEFVDGVSTTKIIEGLISGQ